MDISNSAPLGLHRSLKLRSQVGFKAFTHLRFFLFVFILNLWYGSVTRSTKAGFPPTLKCWRYVMCQSVF